MGHFLRIFTRRFLIFLNILVVVLFLLACSANQLDPVKYWMVALLGVSFAGWLALVFGFFLFWLLLRSKWALLSFITIVIGWPRVSSLIGFHYFDRHFTETKAPGSIRVMQWNVARWDEMIRYKHPDTTTHRLEMFEYIRKNNVDVLCVQEFFESTLSYDLSPNVRYLRDSLHFPYYYFAIDDAWYNGVYQSGIAIFSKYPIVDSFRQRYGGPEALKNNESFISTDIDVQGKTIRVFTTHLQSMLFNREDYHSIRQLKETTDGAVENSKGIARKFRRAYYLRKHQLEVLEPHLRKSPHPAVLCGDFNEVPNSYIYHHIKGDMQDAFVQKGWGLGRTFAFISPTLRIDYILASKQFNVLQYKCDRVRYSDHYPVITDVKIK